MVTAHQHLPVHYTHTYLFRLPTAHFTRCYRGYAFTYGPYTGWLLVVGYTAHIYTPHTFFVHLVAPHVTFTPHVTHTTTTASTPFLLPSTHPNAFYTLQTGPSPRLDTHILRGCYVQHTFLRTHPGCYDYAPQHAQCICPVTVYLHTHTHCIRTHHQSLGSPDRFLHALTLSHHTAGTHLPGLHLPQVCTHRAAHYALRTLPFTVGWTSYSVRFYLFARSPTLVTAVPAHRTTAATHLHHFLRTTFSPHTAPALYLRTLHLHTCRTAVVLLPHYRCAPHIPDYHRTPPACTQHTFYRTHYTARRFFALRWTLFTTHAHTHYTPDTHTYTRLPRGSPPPSFTTVTLHTHISPLPHHTPHRTPHTTAHTHHTHYIPHHAHAITR